MSPHNHTPQKWHRVLLGHTRDILIVTAVGDFFFFVFDPGNFNTLHTILVNSAYSASVGGVIWKGIELVSYFLHGIYSFKEEPGRALVWNLFYTFIYSLVAILGMNYLWVVVLMDLPGTFLFSESFIIVMVIQWVVTITITSIFYSIGFFRAWREAAVSEEKLRGERITLQYNALRNQVNPHFLFNSLNTLTSIVHNDPDMAVRFIRQLSEVYRYLLDQRANDVVSLTSEIAFVEKYIFLQKIRHGQSLNFDMRITGNTDDLLVVPISLQMLVENAIKHNVITSERPLRISLEKENEYIIVRNNLQKKNTTSGSNGIGLDNICSRYEHLTSRKCIILPEGDEFIVKLPLLYHSNP
ncbi:MAG: histidine kinase [Bacteroidales bacterium]|nr:histidine kinase [Bacteroidales bacterium]